MNYKLINSMLHDFGHSFCSDMNMIMHEMKFDGFVYKKINQFFSKSDFSTIVLNFSTEEIAPQVSELSFLKDSVKRYNEWLQQHAVKLGVELNRLHDIVLKFEKQFKTHHLNFNCTASCIDDRHITHEVAISQSP